MHFRTRLLALSLSTSALAATHAASAKSATKPTASAAGRVQNITIAADGSGYHPGIINVKAGRPVRLLFVSRGSGCTNTVVIPSLNKRLHLKMGQQQAVSWTPKKGQSVAFVCGMDMFHGKVVAK